VRSSRPRRLVANPQSHETFRLCHPTPPKRLVGTGSTPLRLEYPHLRSNQSGFSFHLTMRNGALFLVSWAKLFTTLPT